MRSVIEGLSTLNTTARAGQKAAQQVPVLDDFFNALDNAIDNRQRMLDGDTASKADLRDDIRYSKKLGQFADVNVNSEEELKSLGFDAKFPRLKDYIHVQKTVIKALNDRKLLIITTISLSMRTQTLWWILEEVESERHYRRKKDMCICQG